MFALCLRTKHTTNGNPRRVWLIYANEHEATPRYIVDEGYAGRSGVAERVTLADIGDTGWNGPLVLPGPTTTRAAIHAAPVFDVTPAQFNEYAKRKEVLYA